MTIALTGRLSRDRWREVEEWVRTSYTQLAPRRLARQVLDDDVGGS